MYLAVFQAFVFQRELLVEVAEQLPVRPLQRGLVRPHDQLVDQPLPHEAPVPVRHVLQNHLLQFLSYLKL